MPTTFVDYMNTEIDRFFGKARRSDIDALLEKANYEFYKHIRLPDCLCPEDSLELEGAFLMSDTYLWHDGQVIQYDDVDLEPVAAADHQDLALAA